MKKMDEMQKHQSGTAARIAFSFYTVVLLIWSLIDYFKNGNTGWQFPILLIGCALYLWIQVYQNRKTR
ncbi:hypothetical protein WYY_02202 [Bacillus velezensis M27]|uniref:Uncharacterized protein n=1 Tax=Bacillus velezensis TaxID=492670 RepID=A0A6A8LC59_BACVE|nr:MULTISPECIES: hypothetical protein [Bacillus]AIU75412.1 hypothetical protein MA22_02275 [Bacillus subtilis]UXZ17674.1 hypothetical protein KI431_17960 [Bacillus siamensis]COC93457.1 Uncharacterised protein [Streptococcus pneumoniae]AGF25855.1 hypothetical protein KSO_001760 [Bacillus amyloliquefaciens IT-45]AJH25737.1 hypothetical protein SB45_17170 [Bacillus velezensis]